MEIINCPYCSSLCENPVYKEECTTEITCEDCNKRFTVTGIAEWNYKIEKNHNTCRIIIKL